MTGRWHQCGCGCNLWHLAVNGRVACSHPNFGASCLDSEGTLWVSDPMSMCSHCLIELDAALTATTRRHLGVAKQIITIELDEVIQAIDQRLTDEQQIGEMLYEGGAVWEHET